MPFPFAYICDILDNLERLFRRQVPLLHKDLNTRVNEEVTKWFRNHRSKLDAFDTDAEVVMSMLRPKQQLDRLYGIDPENLELIISRGLQLTRDQFNELQRWKTCELLDLAACVQRVMEKSKKGPPRSIVNSVMVEEIDQILLQTAAFQSGSSAEVRDLAKTWIQGSEQVENLGSLYQRLQAKEAKWLTRLVLKDYTPVVFPDALSMVAGQSYLPRCVSISVQIPSSAPPAIRHFDTGSVLGMASLNPNPLPTPPASSPLVPPENIIAAASHIPSSELVSMSVPPVPAKNNRTPAQRLLVTNRKCATVQNITPSSSRSVLGVLSPNVPRASQEGFQTKRTSAGALRGSQGNSQTQPHSTKVTPRFTISGYGVCRFSPEACPLARCLIILSPCISSHPWLTNDLLSNHGIRLLTSISSLNHPSLPRHCPLTGRRYRKLALVESNRPDQTTEFMKNISSIGLKRKGKKEWVEVYDWRLLECLTKVEQGKVADYCPWKRCWIGAV